MKCPNCSNKMERSAGDHKYRESGLDNILLQGIELFSCSCGEKLVSIPCVPELHTFIGKNLLRKSSTLSGKEIRFLRKNIGLSAKLFAEKLGIDKATVSRWEHGKQIPTRAHDHFIRLVYSIIKGVDPKIIRDLIDTTFPCISSDPIKNTYLNIVKDEWTSPRACNLDP
jgi:putative zinc finger/helix-turn-helix YgiT family protein